MIAKLIPLRLSEPPHPGFAHNQSKARRGWGRVLGDVLESVDEEVASTNSEIDSALAEIRERAKKIGKGKPPPMNQCKGPFGLGRSRANVDTPALLSVVSGRPGLQARKTSYPYPHPSHSTGSCVGRVKCAPLMAAGVGRMDQASAGRELAEMG